MLQTISLVLTIVTTALPIIIGVFRVMVGNSAANAAARRTATLAQLHDSLPDRFARELEDELKEHATATSDAFKRSRTRTVDWTNLFMVVVFGILAGGSVWLGFHFDRVWTIVTGCVIGGLLALFTAVGAGQTFKFGSSE